MESRRQSYPEKKVTTWEKLFPKFRSADKKDETADGISEKSTKEKKDDKVDSKTSKIKTVFRRKKKYNAKILPNDMNDGKERKMSLQVGISQHTQKDEKSLHNENVGGRAEKLGEVDVTNTVEKKDAVTINQPASSSNDDRPPASGKRIKNQRRRAPSPPPSVMSESHEQALQEIGTILEDMEGLKTDIRDFCGKSEDDVEYYQLESRLTDAMIRLDGINCDNSARVKRERREGIKSIQNMLKGLDSKIVKDDLDNEECVSRFTSNNNENLINRERLMEGVKACKDDVNGTLHESNRTLMNCHNLSHQSQLNAAFDKIECIIQNVKDVQESIEHFNGVFQNNPEYIQIAEELYKNLSTLNRIPTKHVSDLSNLKHQALHIVHSSIKNLDSKLKSNFSDYFGRFASNLPNNFSNHEDANYVPLNYNVKTQVYPINCQFCTEQDQPSDEYRVKKHYRIEINKERKPIESPYDAKSTKISNRQLLTPETSLKESSISDLDVNCPTSKNQRSEKLDPTSPPESSQSIRLFQKETQCSANDLRDLGREKETVFGQREVIQLRKLQKKFDALLNRFEKLSSASGSSGGNSRNHSLEQLVIDQQTNQHLRAADKVSKVLMQLQVLFVIFVVEIPLLMLFLSVLSWWHKFV